MNGYEGGKEGVLAKREGEKVDENNGYLINLLKFII